MQSFSIYSLSLCTHIYEIVIVVYVKVCILLFSVLSYSSLCYSTVFSIPFFGGAYFICTYFYHLIFMNCEMITTVRSDQIRSVTQSCPTLCDPMNRSTPGLPVHHQLPEFTQTHVHRVSDAIQPSHPLSSPSPLAPNPSQHQSLFQ